MTVNSRTPAGAAVMRSDNHRQAWCAAHQLALLIPVCPAPEKRLLKSSLMARLLRLLRGVRTWN